MTLHDFAGRLQELIAVTPRAPDMTPSVNLERDFPKIRFEWARHCISPVTTTGLRVVAVVAIAWLGFYAAWHSSWFPRSALQPIVDIHFRDSYNKHSATALAITDEKHLAIGTDGGGVVWLRTDAENLGIGRAVSMVTSFGAIPSDRIKAIHQTRDLLFLLGATGGLTTGNRDFSNLRLRFGGEGFVADLNVSRNPGPVDISNEDKLFVVGTTSGAGVYDTITRQWSKLDVAGGMLPSNEVTSVVFGPQRLWIGTAQGLRSFIWTRQLGGNISLRPAEVPAMPMEFRDLPVRDVKLVSAADGPTTLECVIGRGAHLTLVSGEKLWRVRVGQGDDRLKGLNRGSEVDGVVTSGTGTFLGIPGYGPAKYDPVARSLELLDAGLPGAVGERPSMVLASPQPNSPQPPLYLVMASKEPSKGGALYGFNPAKGWEAIHPDWPVKALSFIQRTPLSLLRSGEVRLATKDGGPPLFTAAGPQPSLGAADAGFGQLAVSTAKGGMIRYNAASRGWETLATGTDSPITQVRISSAGPVVVKANGEAGGFAGSEYSAVFGQSALDLRSAPVTSAARLGNDLLFLRAGRIFRYNPAQARIDEFQSGIPKGVAPDTLMFTDKTVYASQSGGALFRNTGANWESINPQGFSANLMAQRLVGSNTFAARSKSGEILLQPDDGQPQIYFFGSGSRTWKKLEGDGSGRLFGLTKSGQVLSYAPARGSWTLIQTAGPVSDLVLDRDGNTLCVSLPTQINCWSVTGEGLTPLGKATLEAKAALSFDVHGSWIWALVPGSTPGSTELTKCELKECKPQSVRTFSSGLGPGPAEWKSALWARFVDHRLAIVTPTVLWEYDLESSGWNSTAIGPLEQGHWSADSGVVWWIRDGSLYGYQIGTEKAFSLSEWHPSAGSARDLSSAAVLAYRWLGGCSLLIAAFAAVLRILNRKSKLLLRGALTLFVVAASAWGIDSFILTPRIQQLTRFETATFTGSVLGFTVADHQLFTQTRAGCFIFSTSRMEVTATGFRPSCSGSTSPTVDDTPQDDLSGAWHLARDTGGYRLRRRLAGEWREWNIGDGGFEPDKMLRIAIAGERVVGVASGGLIELDSESRKIESFRPTRATAGRLFSQSGDVWSFSETGAFRVSGRGDWAPVSNTNLSAEAQGIHWNRDWTGDQIDSAVFDDGTGRFISDISLSIQRDSGGHLWVQTRGGWRSAVVEGGAVKLVRSQVPPPPPTIHQEWNVNSRWKITSTEREDGTPAISFIFTPTGRQLGSDPFGNRGRFPDEDAVSIAPAGSAVWIGTHYGLRVIGSDEIQLPGVSIEAQGSFNGTFYSRTDDGTYGLGSKGWVRQVAPDGLFKPWRSIQLKVGSGLTIYGTENIAGGTAHTTLAGFSPDSGRFTIDAIRGMDVDQKSVLLGTAGGLQAIDLDERGGIAGQSMTLPDVAISSLRRASEGSLFAAADGGRVWRLDGRRWTEVNSHGSPFESPQHGTISNIVQWRRVYSQYGDQWHLISTLGDITFVDGKLSSDYIEAIADGEYQAEVSIAGVLLNKRLLAKLPEAARYRVERETIVARTKDSGFRLEGADWRPAPQALSMKSATFTGLGWQFAPIFSMESLIDVNATQSQQILALDYRGQFPFDDIQAVTTQHGSALLAHEGGVSIYSTREWRHERELPVLDLHGSVSDVTFATSGECQVLIVGAKKLGSICDGDNALRAEADLRKEPGVDPEFQWGGGIGDDATIARIAGENSITLNRTAMDPAIVPVPDRAVAFGGGFNHLWVLTAHRLYRLDKEFVPGRYADRKGVTQSQPQPQFVLSTVFFAPGSAELTQSDSQKIEKSVASLTAIYSRRLIAVESYVDPSGTLEQKKALAADRAETVARYLRQLGIDGSHIQVITHPAPPLPASASAWAQMRRTEIIVKAEQ